MKQKRKAKSLNNLREHTKQKTEQDRDDVNVGEIVRMLTQGEILQIIQSQDELKQIYDKANNSNCRAAAFWLYMGMQNFLNEIQKNHKQDNNKLQTTKIVVNMEDVLHCIEAEFDWKAAFNL
eukprot:2959572-Rhodomonas_salina.1